MSKDELREKLSSLYKAPKDQVSCFGFRTQYGGGKSTGFALVYDSGEAMKKFEPHYRLVRYGQASKIEKASRQQREYTPEVNKATSWNEWEQSWEHALTALDHRQAAQEPPEGAPGHGEGHGQEGEEGQIEACRDGGCCYGSRSLLLLLHATPPADASVAIALGGRLSWCSYIECDQTSEQQPHLVLGLARSLGSSRPAWNTSHRRALPLTHINIVRLPDPETSRTQETWRARAGTRS